MPDRQVRIKASLDAVHEALRMARREAAGVEADPERWRWIAVGMVIALQGALVAALSGYESADAADVIDPSTPERFAPVALLLRRARSTDYLNSPQRLELTASQVRQIEHVVTYRNGVVHGWGGGGPADDESVMRGCRRIVQVVGHAVLVHPSFDAAGHGVICALIADEVAGLERMLVALG